MFNRTVAFLAADLPGADKQAPAAGTYRVLATLSCGQKSYRILADLLIDEGDAKLQFYGFELPTGDEWFGDRKISVPLAQAEVAAIERKVSGAEFVLCSPVCLDQAKAAVVFGPSGPPMS